MLKGNILCRVWIVNTTGNTVVNETDPTSPGEKFNETYGPLVPKEKYTIAVVPKVDGIQGIPRYFNITTGMRDCKHCQRQCY